MAENHGWSLADRIAMARVALVTYILLMCWQKMLELRREGGACKLR